jgi:hypothetical protein
MVFRSRQSPYLRTLAGLALTAFLVSVCPGAAWVPAALAADREDLARAQEHYDFAEFSQALSLLDGLIAEGGLRGDALRDAYVLKARSLVGLGHTATAMDAYCDALRLDSDWRPDPVVFPKDEIEVFERALDTCSLEAPPPPAQAAAGEGGTPWYKKPIAWVAGGAVLIVGVLALGGGDDGGDGGGDSLPDFPEPPTTTKE